MPSRSTPARRHRRRARGARPAAERRSRSRPNRLGGSLRRRECGDAPSRLQRGRPFEYTVAGDQRRGLVRRHGGRMSADGVELPRAPAAAHRRRAPSIVRRTVAAPDAAGPLERRRHDRQRRPRVARTAPDRLRVQHAARSCARAGRYRATPGDRCLVRDRDLCLAGQRPLCDSPAGRPAGLLGNGAGRRPAADPGLGGRLPGQSPQARDPRRHVRGSASSRGRRSCEHSIRLSASSRPPGRSTALAADGPRVAFAVRDEADPVQPRDVLERRLESRRASDDASTGQAARLEGRLTGSRASRSVGAGQRGRCPRHAARRPLPRASSPASR